MTKTFKKDAILIAKYKAQIELQRQSLRVTINPEYLEAARKVAEQTPPPTLMR